MNRSRILAIAIAGAVAAAALIGAAVSSAAPRADPPHASVRSGDRPLVAFYGDSYTLGTGASDPSVRWSTRISEQRGWTEFNPSVNGLGFVNNRRAVGEGSGDLPDQIIEQKPDIVFVTMGLNDNFSYDVAADEIHSRITEDLERLTGALPDARFIVVEPFWYTDAPPESLGVISGWIEDAATAVGADHISGASHWIEGHPEWMAADGLHPNDDGYAAMTERMDEELKNLGL